MDLREESTVRALEKGIADVEAWRVSEVLRISRELGADFCGLEKLVRRAAPLRFDRMRVGWRERFLALPIQVEIAVKLARGHEGTIEPLPGRERAAG